MNQSTSVNGRQTINEVLSKLVDELDHLKLRVNAIELEFNDVKRKARSKRQIQFEKEERERQEMKLKFPDELLFTINNEWERYSRPAMYRTILMRHWQNTGPEELRAALEKLVTEGRAVEFRTKRGGAVYMPSIAFQEMMLNNEVTSEWFEKHNIIP